MYTLVNKLMNIHVAMFINNEQIRDDTTRLIFQKIEGSCLLQTDLRRYGFKVVSLHW